MRWVAIEYYVNNNLQNFDQALFPYIIQQKKTW